MKRKHPLAGLMAFVGQSEWSGIFGQLLDEHLRPTLDGFGLTTEALIKILGKSRTATLWGCVMEDLVARYVGTRSDNVVDAYLRHSGRSEQPLNKSYMVALRQSVMSLYEVTEACAGDELVLRDAVRSTEPLLVHADERLKDMVPGDWIAARLIPDGDTEIVTGSLLSLSGGSASTVIDEMRNIASHLGLAPTGAMRHAELHLLAPVFTQAWLLENLPASFDLSEATGRH